VFAQSDQTAIINNEWKILEKPHVGQCNEEPGMQKGQLGLYNLDDDPTESVDLSKSPAHTALFSKMSSQLDAFKTSIEFSRFNESGC